MLCLSNEIEFTLLEILFRHDKAYIRYNEMLFLNNEVAFAFLEILFRYDETCIRYNEMLFLNDEKIEKKNKHLLLSKYSFDMTKLVFDIKKCYF